MRLTILTFCETALLSPLVVIAILGGRTTFSLMTYDLHPNKEGKFNETWYEANEMILPVLMFFLMFMNHFLVPWLKDYWY